MRKIRISLFLLLGVLLLTGCNTNVVATVNGEEITQQQLDKRVSIVKDYYEKQYGQKIEGQDAQKLIDNMKPGLLDEMISDTLKRQEARKVGKDMTDQQIQEKIDGVKKQFPNEEAFKNFLAQQDLTEKDMAYMLNLQDVVLKDVKAPTEEEVQEYYDQNKEQFKIAEQYEVRHILISTDPDDAGNVKHTEAEAEKLAVQVLADIKNGKDFAALAREKSEDLGSKDNGGLYTFKKGDTVPEFEKAALALKPGEYTREPVKTQFGYHIIKLEKLIPVRDQSFAEVKDGIKQQLDQEAKKNKFNAYLEDLKKKAKITNKLAETGDNKSKD
jgi:peptidyl-prolyl cis-trans isomerase C